MKIIDIITQNKLFLSFEVFPPKNETSFESVKAATEEIAKLQPSFLSGILWLQLKYTYGILHIVSWKRMNVLWHIKERCGKAD